jgi:hypothetical protein
MARAQHYNYSGWSIQFRFGLHGVEPCGYANSSAIKAQDAPAYKPVLTSCSMLPGSVRGGLSNIESALEGKEERWATGEGQKGAHQWCVLLCT